MTIVRVPKWGLSVHRAEYYGCLFAVHLGPFLIFCKPV